MKKVFLVLLAAVFLLAGCDENPETGSNGEEKPEPEDTYSLHLPVELEAVELAEEGVRVITEHPEYGTGIFPEKVLSDLMFPIDSGEIKPGDNDWIKLSWKESSVEILPGTRQFRVDGREKEADGPSFWEDRRLYLHGSVAAAVDRNVRWNENGLIWVTDREEPETEPAELEKAASFKGELGFLSLVNRDHHIDKEEEGKELINLNREYPELTYLRNNMLMNRKAAGEMAEMLDDATEEPDINSIPLVSTYRSYDYQEGVLQRRINRFIDQGYSRERAESEARRIVAEPGTSEHQTGLAVDFTSRELLDRGRTLTSDFYDTPEGDWLRRNSWKYGFILRYPADTEEITGIVEEAWHYRYVGRPHAEIISSRDMVLETYMKHLRREKSFIYEDVHGDCYLIVYLDGEMAEITSVDLSLGQVSCTNEGGLVVTLPLPSTVEGCSAD